MRGELEASSRLLVTRLQCYKPQCAQPKIAAERLEVSRTGCTFRQLGMHDCFRAAERLARISLDFGDHRFWPVGRLHAPDSAAIPGLSGPALATLVAVEVGKCSFIGRNYLRRAGVIAGCCWFCTPRSKKGGTWRGMLPWGLPSVGCSRKRTPCTLGTCSEPFPRH